jgi:hypothetical protein
MNLARPNRRANAELGAVSRTPRRLPQALRGLGYVLVVLVLVVAIPTVVRAAGPPTVTLGPSAGIVGSTVYVNGSGFPASSTVTIVFNDSHANYNLFCAACAVSASGTFSDHYPVPAATNGNATVTAYEVGASSSAIYGVEAHQQLTGVSGPPGTVIAVTGTGFDPDSVLTYHFGEVTPGLSCNGHGTSATGGFTCDFRVPTLPYGIYLATAADDTGNLANNSVNFLLTPGGSSAPGSGSVGSTVTVTVDGFPAYAPLEVIWDPGLPTSTVLATPLTGGTGTVTAHVAVPSSAFGDHTIEVYYSTTVLEKFSFFVLGSLSMAPSSGYVGETGILTTGLGLPANSMVTLYWDPGTAVNSTLGGAPTAANGTFTASFTVPSASRGPHEVSATVGGVALANATFTIDISNLSLSPTTGPPRGLVTATLAGFAANSAANVIWDEGLLTQSLLGNGTTSDRGALTLVGLTVPATASAGNQLVTARDAADNAAMATFAVGPELTADPVLGAVGSNVTVDGYAFPSYEPISLRWNSTTGTLLATIPALSGSAAYPYGNFTTTISVPVSPFGVYEIYAVVTGTPTVATAAFSVIGSLTLSAIHGPVGTDVTATAEGLLPNSLSTLSIDGTSTGLGTVSGALGTASFSFAMPPEPAGSHGLRVSDAHGDLTNTVSFTVDPSLSATPAAAYPGQSITVNLAGFAAASVVTLAWDGAGTQTTAATTGSGSALAVPFSVPASPPGTYTLGAWDLLRNVAPAVEITVLALPVPSLVGPANQADLNSSVVSLSWSPAPNGNVTYAVELASSSDFTSGTITVSGLTGTAWTPPPLLDGSYYWAVEAVAPGGATAGFSSVRSFLVDTVAPSSSVGPLPTTVVGLDLAIPFTATDPSPGSGVLGVELLYSVDGGHAWVAYDGGALFSASPIAFVAPVPGLYEFQTVAVDHAGNRQSLSATGQATVIFNPAATSPNYAPYVFVGGLVVLGAIAIGYLLRHRRDKGPSTAPRAWSESSSESASEPSAAGRKEGP